MCVETVEAPDMDNRSLDLRVCRIFPYESLQD